MQVTPGLGFTRITIVDDVVTRGAMLLAAAQLVAAAYPDAEVRAFALVRTCNLGPEIDRSIDPVIGTITLSRWGDARPRSGPRAVAFPSRDGWAR
jgi:hypothetical protein